MLKELLEEYGDFSDLNKQLNEYGVILHNLLDEMQTLIEDSSSTGETVTSELLSLMDATMKQFAAAKRGLGIANRLKTPEDKKKHRSRIMGTMNRIRAAITKIQKMMK
jgi:hypothetical protein